MFQNTVAFFATVFLISDFCRMNNIEFQQSFFSSYSLNLLRLYRRLFASPPLSLFSAPLPFWSFRGQFFLLFSSGWYRVSPFPTSSCFLFVSSFNPILLFIPFLACIIFNLISYLSYISLHYQFNTADITHILIIINIIYYILYIFTHFLFFYFNI